MNRAAVYPWIWNRPKARRRVGRPMTAPPPSPCRRCGYDPVGDRKKCPACMVRVAG